MFFDEGSFRLRIADKMKDTITAYIDKKITLGIRPEDIYDKLFVAKAEPDTTVNVTVDVIEHMGSEVYLYLNTEKSCFIARVRSRSTPKPFQKLDVVLDMSKAYFFDIKTEKAII